VWADNNPAEVQHTVDKYLNENPNASRNPGTRRHVVCSEFKKLPDQERLIWSSKAVEVRKEQEAEGVLKGEELEK
jgi:hypothetical protein